MRTQMDWSSYYCARCCDGGELLECDGVCLRAFHVACLALHERPRPSDLPETPWCAAACLGMLVSGVPRCTRWFEVHNLQPLRMAAPLDVAGDT